MNQAHLQLSLSRGQTFLEDDKPYLVALDTVDSYYGTGAKTFYFDERTYKIEVPPSDDNMSKSFYMSGQIWVRDHLTHYTNTDGMDIAIRLDEDYGEKPYTACGYQRFKPTFLPIDPSIHDLGYLPVFSLSLSTIITVNHEVGGLIYFLVSAKGAGVDEKMLSIDAARLSCIQIESMQTTSD